MVFEKEEKSEVQWNVSQEHSRFVHSILVDVKEFYLSGNLGSWHWSLSALRENINHDLSKEQRVKFDKMEKDLKKCIKHWDKYITKTRNYQPVDNSLIKIKNYYERRIRNYQRCLMDVLKEQGYFPSKEDKRDLGY